MANLSISTAWTEGLRFGAREFGLLFPISFLLTGLPNVILGLVVPQENSPGMYALVLFVQRNGMLPIILLALAIVLLVMAFSTLGSLAITYLALRPGASVGEGLRAGARRLPAVLGAILLGVMVFVVAAFLLAATLVGTGAVPTMERDRVTGGMLLMFLVVMLLAVALGVRFITFTPVGAAERLGPIGIIGRSWRLTRGHFWQIFGAMLLVGIVLGVIGVLVSLLFGFIIMGTIGNPLIDPAAIFAHDLVNAVFASAAAVFMLPFIARIYVQLAAEEPAT